MPQEPSELDKMLDKLFSEHDHEELTTQGIEVDIQTEEFQHYSIVEKTLLSNGVSLPEEGIDDYFDYCDNVSEHIHDITYSRMANILSALGFLAYETRPLSQITQIDENTVVDLESIFLHEDEHDLAWLKTLREILPNASFLQSTDDTELISNFRDRSTLRGEIGATDSRLRKNARAILTAFVIKNNGEHDDNSIKVTRLVGGVIGIYGGEDPVVSDMLIRDASKILESFGYTADEAVSLLKSIHDQSI